MNSKLKTCTAFTLTLFAVLASGCNTIEGAGEDLESAGDKAEEITRND